MTKTKTVGAKLLLGASQLAAGIVLTTASVAAETPLNNKGLPTLAQVKPLPKPYRAYREPATGLLHNFKLSVEAGTGLTEKRKQPTKLKQNSYGTQLGLSFGIGSMGFASITGSYSRENIKSTILAFPLAMDASANAGAVDAVLGIAPLPFLRVGVLGGLGTGSSAYSFVGVPAPSVGAKSNGYRYGAFVGASYPVGPVMMSLDATIISVHNRQEYDPGNIPPSANFGSNIAMVQLGASYDMTDRLRLSAGFVVNQVLSQKVAPADRGLDKSWFTLQLGAGYMLTERWEVTLKGMTWLSNQRMNYSRATIGASYKF
ncbi:MAG: hypothetical protein CFE31_08180 [Rhizobiales bacterium PAR1]|nr:MAG: hypothetical protein CFE31_08180 [Rhizobiales bacterium PAR1]